MADERAACGVAVTRSSSSVAPPHASAFVAHHRAPLIGERAATRGRSATEGGDEHAGAKEALSVRAPAWRTGPNGGNLDAERRRYEQARQPFEREEAATAKEREALRRERRSGNRPAPNTATSATGLRRSGKP